MDVRAWVGSLAVALLVGGTVPAAQAALGVDDLFTTYQTSGKSIGFTVCNRAGGADACGEQAVLPATFERACALIETTPKLRDGLLVRNIYVLDKAKAQEPIRLYVFRRKESLGDTVHIVDLHLTSVVPLGIGSRKDAHCSLAANNDAVFAGTDAAATVAQIDRATLAVQSRGRFSPPTPVSSISSDHRGSIVMTFGNAFEVTGPQDGGTGGGAAFTVDTHNAFAPPGSARVATASTIKPLAARPRAHPIHTEMLRGRAPRPGSGLTAEYTLWDEDTFLDVSICGHVGRTHGCYGFGAMQGFEKACALLESSPRVSGNVVTRDIYVLDRRATTTAPVKLYVFTRTDTFTDSDSDTVRVVPRSVVAFRLTGGPDAQCTMAADNLYLFAGTNAGGNVARVKKGDLSQQTMRSESGLIRITSDNRGYVSIRRQNGSIAIDPTGVPIGPVSGNMVDTRNGLLFNQ